MSCRDFTEEGVMPCRDFTEEGVMSCHDFTEEGVMSCHDFTEEGVMSCRDQRPSPRVWSGWLERLPPPALDGLPASAASPTRRHDSDDSLILQTKYPFTQNTLHPTTAGIAASGVRRCAGSCDYVRPLVSLRHRNPSSGWIIIPMSTKEHHILITRNRSAIIGTGNDF